MASILVNMLAGEPDRMSGISNYAFCLLRELAALKRDDYTLLTNWSQEALSRHLPLDAIRLVRRDAFRSEKLSYPANARLVAREADAAGADVVFTPHPYGAPFGGKARVMVVHDIYRETHPALHRLDRRLAWKAFFGFSLARSNAIVCVSEATRADLTRLHPATAGRSLTIHEASTIGAEPKKRRGQSTPYALIVANSAPTKNFPMLTDALAELVKRRSGVRLVWVGRDDSGDVARALHNHTMLLNFMPRGPVGEAELAGLYANARFYVACSLAEGFCLPVVEAQRLGVPVIASDIPVLREVGGDGAIFVDPASHLAWADAMEALWDDEAARTELSARAKANAERFSWRKAAEEMSDVFRDVLNR